MRKFMRTRTPAAVPTTNGHVDGAVSGIAHSSNTTRRGSSRAALSRVAALYEDDQFPARWRALGDVRWRRPHEVAVRPRYYSDDQHDNNEQLLDRWQVVLVGAIGAGGAAVCAAAAALTSTPRLLQRALPPHSFEQRYCGAFRFRFCVWGEWREVVVDDRLPTRGGRVLGAASALPGDFTLSLLHKAYAKLYGGYAALRGGTLARALQDLTGAVVQLVPLRHHPPAFVLRALDAALTRSTLLVCSPHAPRAGLLPAQAYCVTGLARARDAGVLVRVRAVCARGLWDGEAMRALPPADRELLAERLDHPGEFWMPWGEFADAFVSVVLVHVGPDDWLREPALHARRPWRAVVARRRWRSGYNAGGAPPLHTADTNPQFQVEVRARTCHVLVSVTQRYEPRVKSRLHAIGFSVYEAGGDGAGPVALRTMRALHAERTCRAREVVALVTLAPGHYVVVPYTQRAHTHAAFLLRVLTDEHADVWELNEDNVIMHDLSVDMQRDDRATTSDVRNVTAKLVQECGTDEVDAELLRASLRRALRVCVSRDVSVALLSLYDATLSGAMSARNLSALIVRVSCWRDVWTRYTRRRCARSQLSSYIVRAVLRDAGVSVSNKVLESVVIRYTTRHHITHDNYLLALARIHLAHERYRSLDAKLKSCPLSLEEVILMTIYS